MANERDRDDAVLEGLEADAEAVGAGHVDGVAIKGDRRLTVLHIGRRRRLRRETRGGARAKLALHTAEVDCLRDVEEEKRGDVTRERVAHRSMLARAGGFNTDMTLAVG